MSGATVKAALVAALAAAFTADTAVTVSYGDPGDPPPTDDVLALMGVANAPLADEDAWQVAFTISCYVGGTVAAQQTATERAYSLLATMTSTLAGDPTVGGACRLALVDRDHVLEERLAFNVADTPVGWLADITGTITARTGTGVLGSLRQVVT